MAVFSRLVLSCILLYTTTTSAHTPASHRTHITDTLTHHHHSNNVLRHLLAAVTTKATEAAPATAAAAAAATHPAQPSVTTPADNTAASTPSDADSVNLPTQTWGDISANWADGSEDTSTPTETSKTAEKTTTEPTTAAEPVETTAPQIQLCPVKSVTATFDDEEQHIVVQFTPDTKASKCTSKDYMIQMNTDKTFASMEQMFTQQLAADASQPVNSAIIETVLIPTISYYIRVLPFDADSSTTGVAVNSSPAFIKLPNSPEFAEYSDSEIGYQVQISFKDKLASSSSPSKLLSDIAGDMNSLIDVSVAQFAAAVVRSDNILLLTIIPGDLPAAEVADKLRLLIESPVLRVASNVASKFDRLMNVEAVQQCSEDLWQSKCPSQQQRPDPESRASAANTPDDEEMPPLPISMSDAQQDPEPVPSTNNNADNKQDNGASGSSSGGSTVVPSPSSGIYDRDTDTIFGVSPVLLLAMVGGVIVVGGYAFLTSRRSRNTGYSAVNGNNANIDAMAEDYNDDIEMAVSKPSGTTARAKPLDSSSDIDDDDELSLSTGSGGSYTDKLTAIGEHTDGGAVQLAETVMNNLSIPSYGHTTYTKKLKDQSISTIAQLKQLTTTDYKTLNLPFVIEDAIKKAVVLRDNSVTDKQTNGAVKPRTAGLSLSKSKPAPKAASKPTKPKITATVLDIDDDDDDFGLNMHSNGGGASVQQRSTADSSADWGDDLELDMHNGSAPQTSNRAATSATKKPAKGKGKSKILVAQDYDDDGSDAFEDF